MSNCIVPKCGCRYGKADYEVYEVVGKFYYWVNSDGDHLVFGPFANEEGAKAESREAGFQGNAIRRKF